MSFNGIQGVKEEQISPQIRVIYQTKPDEFVKPKNGPKEPINKENDKKISTGAKEFSQYFEKTLFLFLSRGMC